MSEPGNTPSAAGADGPRASPVPSERSPALALCGIFLVLGALWLLAPVALDGDATPEGARHVARDALFLAATTVLLYVLARRALAPPPTPPRSPDEPPASSRLAHDLGNVLTVVTGYADLALERTPPDHPLHGDLAALRGAARRGLELAHGQAEPGAGPGGADLARLVADAGRVLPRVAGPRIQVELDLELACAPVRIAAPALEQVLLNLTLNARDAMPEGGTLRLRLSARDGEALLEVTDTGHGLDEATRQRMFEPGFTTRAGGRGLGLPGAARTVSAAGGRIEVESAPGRGASFRVRLPLAGPAVPLPGGLGEPLLLLEPQADRRRELTRRLVAAGYRVQSAATPDEALSAARREAPALLLLGHDADGARLAETLAPLPALPTTAAAHELLVAVRSALDAGLPAAAPAASRPPGRLALIVDDEDAVREVVARMFRDGGWDTLTAAHGAEALALARRTRPSLVVLDMLMPDMEGIETLGRMREACPGVPVLAISGAAHAADYLLMAVRLGASAALPKPFEAASLLALADQALQSSGALAGRPDEPAPA